MTTEIFSPISTDHRRSGQIRRKVGLKEERTGIPLFLICTSINKVEIDRFTLLSEIQMKWESAESLFDQTAWENILRFFQLGGQEAWVINTPLDPLVKAPDEKHILKSLLGENLGFQLGTGMHAISRIVDMTDLILIPQTALFTTKKIWTTFHQALFLETQKLPNLFHLLELPEELSEEEVTKWSSSIQSETSALFYPWVFNQELQKIPASIFAAACLQWADRNIRLLDTPANIPHSKINPESNQRILPLRKLSASLNTKLNQSQVNTILINPKGETKIWGSKTLAREGQDSGISIQRKVLAIQSLLEETCEPFVFGPNQDSVYENIEMAVENSLQKVSFLFDDTQVNPFLVKCSPKKRKSGTEIQLNCFINLLTSTESVHMDLSIAS